MKTLIYLQSEIQQSMINEDIKTTKNHKKNHKNTTR